MFNFSVLSYQTVTSGYLTDTNNYLNSDPSLSGLSTTSKDGIDRWIRDLQGYSNSSYTTFNVWSKITAMYPMLGGTLNSVAVNAKNPGIFTLTHVGTPTVTTNGISYNGTSQYSNTGCTPSNSGTVNDVVTGFGLHRRDSNEDTNATFGVASGGNTYLICRSDGFRSVQAMGNGLAGSTPTVSVNSLWQASYSDSTAVGNFYTNGVNRRSTSSLSLNNTGNKAILIGAFQAASPGYGGANTVDYTWLCTGTWSDVEQAFMYNAFDALQKAVGKTVFALVANTSKVPASINSNTVTSNAITTTGATLIIAIVVDYTAATVLGSVTDNKSNTWSQAVSQAESLVSRTTIFYSKPTSVGASHTFTYTSAATSYPTIYVMAFSGTGTITVDSTNGQSNSNMSSTNILQTGTASPSQTYELVVTGVNFWQGSAGSTINNSFIVTDTQGFISSLNFGGGAAYLIQSSVASPVNPTWTSPVNPGRGSAAIATFKINA